MTSIIDNNGEYPIEYTMYPIELPSYHIEVTIEVLDGKGAVEDWGTFPNLQDAEDAIYDAIK